jgi:replicative DNA helicase
LSYLQEEAMREKKKEAPPAPPPGLMPPHDLEAEQSVLGAVLLKPAVFDDVADLVKPEDFYRDAHGTIFRTMIDLWVKKEPIDLVTVCGLLQTRGKLEEVGGAVFMAQLSEHVGFSANAPFYAKKVRDTATLRKFLNCCQTVAQGCLGPVEDVSEFIDQAEADLFSIQDRKKTVTRQLEELLVEEIARTEELFHRRGETLGVPSGFTDLDAVTGGWQPGDLILVAARPSMGKTALATNFALNSGVPVAFFSLEMSAQQIAQRIICAEGHIDSSRLRTGSLNTDEWTQLQVGIAPTMDKKLFVNDVAALSPMDLRAQARRLAIKHKINLIVVDYLQLMSYPKARSREQEVSEISRSLKGLAKELHLPVIALSQLNRDVEKRTNRKPILSDLRDSGSLEQDADVILFIYRDKVYREEKGDPWAEINIAKQRNGPVKKVRLMFLPQFSTFENYAGEEEPC